LTAQLAQHSVAVRFVEVLERRKTQRAHHLL
jgi:hypothetical protein